MSERRCAKRALLWIGIAFSFLIAGVLLLWIGLPKRSGIYQNTQTAISLANRTSTVEAGQSPTTTHDWRIYRDVKFGYSFQYPPDWSMVASSDYTQVLVDQSQSSSGNYENGAEISAENWGPGSISTESDFDRLAAQYLQHLCIAGTDQHPIYPISVETEVTSTNPNGILSIRAYFEAMTDNGPTASETTAGIMGPIYGFYIWPQTGGAANMLVLIPGHGMFSACEPSNSPREESPSIQGLVKTLTF